PSPLYRPRTGMCCIEVGFLGCLSVRNRGEKPLGTLFYAGNPLSHFAVPGHCMEILEILSSSTCLSAIHHPLSKSLRDHENPFLSLMRGWQYPLTMPISPWARPHIGTI